MSVSLFSRLNAGTCPHTLRLALTKCRQLQVISQSCLIEGSSSVGPVIVSTSRCFSMSHAKSREIWTKEVLETKDEKNIPVIREHYIPITRQTIIRYLTEESDFFTDSEKKIFPQFARSLDCAIMNQYRGVLIELKTLFDPINPDKDTIKTREYTRQEKLDNEFWMLEKLTRVLAKANFNELPKPVLHKYLSEHNHGEGIKVSVDPNRYDVLRCWVLGHETPKVSLTLTERMKNAILRRPPRKAMEYYKRVVLAIRLKRESKLSIKAFKEVPIENIEMLLPDGTVRMSTMDKGILVTTGATATFAMVAKVVTNLAHIPLNWTVLVASVTGFIGLSVWGTYKNKRNSYLVDVTQTLYYKNVANNRGLLTLLVDRAEDETVKEALLTFAFLLTSMPAVLRDKPKLGMEHHSGGLTLEELQEGIDAWIEKRTGVKLHFDSSEAIPLLTELGLINMKNDKVMCVMLDLARKMLPPPVQSVLVRDDGLMDGYDRDEFLETEEEYMENTRRAKRYGWF